MSHIQFIFKFHPFELLQLSNWRIEFLYVPSVFIILWQLSISFFHYIDFLERPKQLFGRTLYLELFHCMCSFFLVFPGSLIDCNTLNKKISWVHNTALRQKDKTEGDRKSKNQAKKQKNLKFYWRCLLHQFFTLKISNQKEISIHSACVLFCFPFKRTYI